LIAEGAVAIAQSTRILAVMKEFADAIAAELERPRPLGKQVSDHLCSHQSLSRDGIAVFLASETEKLEEYELDLIFSPLFTPSLEDQALYSELLDRSTLPASEWPALVQQLANRPVLSRLLTEDGQTSPVKLHAVVIERYVNRLNLDVQLPGPLAKLLNTLPPAEDHALLKALARRAIWKVDSRREVLFRYLLASTSDDFYDRADLVSLLKLMENYQPNDAAEIVGRIPHWLKVIEKEIMSAAGPKPFFAPRVQELHGGGRDQRHPNQVFIDGKKRESNFLARLQTVLSS
jgi:hypothetical protein